VRHGPARAGEMPAVIVDPSRAKATGWAPRYSFEQGLEGVWEEWSAIDLEAVAAGVGAVGSPAGVGTPAAAPGAAGSGA
jgi:hypothetical protein